MKLLDTLLAFLGMVCFAGALATPLQDAVEMKCVEGELRCLAANSQGKDGGVFKCVNGFWDLIQDCRDFERCVSKPTPHCTWAQLRRGNGLRADATHVIDGGASEEFEDAS